MCQHLGRSYTLSLEELTTQGARAPGDNTSRWWQPQCSGPTSALKQPSLSAVLPNRQELVWGTKALSSICKECTGQRKARAGSASTGPALSGSPPGPVWGRGRNLGHISRQSQDSVRVWDDSLTKYACMPRQRVFLQKSRSRWLPSEWT